LDSTGNIGFRHSPYSALPVSLSVGGPWRSLVLRAYLTDGVFLAEARAFALDGFPWFDPSSSAGLVSPGLPVGGRIPPGGYPSPLCPIIADELSRHRLVLSFTDQGANPEKADDEVRWTFSRMFLFQGFPHLPFSLASLAARVDRRWLSRSAREPLGKVSSGPRFRNPFLLSQPHFSVYR
jgi:hypothetical protein